MLCFPLTTDDGALCENKDVSACAAAEPRCTLDMLEGGATVCKNTTCSDLLGPVACSGFEYDTCEWNAAIGACKREGARDPCDRIYNKDLCLAAQNCTYNDNAGLCYYEDEEIPCSKFQTENVCPQDRCVYYPTIPLCADSGAEVPCSAYASEVACRSNTACKYVPGAFACTDADASLDCSAITNLVGCGATPGCKVQGTACVLCDGGEADATEQQECTGSGFLPPCEELDQCSSQYCLSTNEGCVAKACEQVLSRFHCDAFTECRYDPFTYACVGVDTQTACEHLPTESICAQANEEQGREQACLWNSAYEVCYGEGDSLPCSAFSNATACDARSYCEWNVICRDYETTTTTTTTTTTEYINACDRRP